MVWQIFQVPLLTIDPKVAFIARENQIGDDVVATSREKAPANCEGFDVV
jgi:hypothetical protein